MKSKTKRQKTNKTKRMTNITKTNNKTRIKIIRQQKITKANKNKLACLKKLVADKFFSRKTEPQITDFFAVVLGGSSR